MIGFLVSRSLTSYAGADITTMSGEALIYIVLSIWDIVALLGIFLVKRFCLQEIHLVA